MELSIKRLDLIAALEAKATANQKLYDDAINRNLEATTFCNSLIDAAFGPTAADGTFGKIGTSTSYNKAQARTAMNTFLSNTGAGPQTIHSPRLYTAEIAALKLATNEELTISSGDAIWGNLGLST